MLVDVLAVERVGVLRCRHLACRHLRVLARAIESTRRALFRVLIECVTRAALRVTYTAVLLSRVHICARSGDIFSRLVLLSHS